MTIIAGLFAGSFGRILGPRKGALAAVIGISVYTILVGADAASCRRPSWEGCPSSPARWGSGSTG